MFQFIAEGSEKAVLHDLSWSELLAQQAEVTDSHMQQAMGRGNCIGRITGTPCFQIIQLFPDQAQYLGNILEDLPVDPFPGPFLYISAGKILVLWRGP